MKDGDGDGENEGRFEGILTNETAAVPQRDILWNRKLPTTVPIRLEVAVDAPRHSPIRYGAGWCWLVLAGVYLLVRPLSYRLPNPCKFSLKLASHRDCALGFCTSITFRTANSNNHHGKT